MNSITPLVWETLMPEMQLPAFIMPFDLHRAVLLPLGRAKSCQLDRSCTWAPKPAAASFLFLTHSHKQPKLHLPVPCR